MLSRAERYIQTCTHGLPPKSRQLVALELRGHIQERTREWMEQGLPHPEALNRTLEELGAPAQIGAGFRTVHWNHTLLRSVMLCALVVALSPGLFRSSLPALALTNEAFIQRHQAEELLSSLGLTSPVELPDPPINVSFNYKGKDMVRTPSLRWNDQPFVNISYLLLALKQAGPIHVQGWNNPVLSVENTRVSLGSPEKPITAYPIYLSELQRIIGSQYSGQRMVFATPSSQENRSGFFLSAPQRSGEVYALVAAHQSEDGLEFAMDVLPSSADGLLNFELGYLFTHLQLYGSWNAFQTASLHAPYGASASRPVPAMLVSLSSTLDGTFTVLPRSGIFTAN
ncbi:permease prefix domain 1-containing protein [Deinococcus roseus]|uniref:DUF4179 domain-containing protein n=1 Tax=Deinococcus roseus TaxID=392414 RepID=A0ABQ2DFU8_9DEIO|nr:permease prefix domain 1-containing protein [Deinococcus roseus]GGJ56306.1 hypothetical protein GCM10008938_48100 [Deinococcus roseus]